MIKIDAYAKINLTLDVLGKRSDGYHELSTIMQTVELCDTLVVKKTNMPGVTIKTSHPLLSTNEGNLVFLIAQFLIMEYNIRHGVSVELIKRIPLAAGLAGGSADCAATLLALNDLFELNLKYDELCKIGKKFGADVPFCVRGGTALAEGIGERLTTLADHPEVWIVLAKLPISVSTKDIFTRWKLQDAQPMSHKMQDAIESGDVKKIAANFSNMLMPIATDLHPEIFDVMTALQKQDAIGVNMSGSGPTVFAYFIDENKAIEAAEYVKNHFIDCELFITRPKPGR